jgi:hypothetical protein
MRTGHDRPQWAEEDEMTVVRIPKIFAEDRLDRGLDNGEGEYKRGAWVTNASPDLLDDLKSDAEWQVLADDAGWNSIKRSARRFLDNLDA